MAKLGLEGPWDLTAETVQKQIVAGYPGNYALGRVSSGIFYVHYVGRSDEDLLKRLLQWAALAKHSQFKASYASSPAAAFAKECENYHDFTTAENRVHPARPDHTAWQCPRCNEFDLTRRGKPVVRASRG